MYIYTQTHIYIIFCYYSGELPILFSCSMEVIAQFSFLHTVLTFSELQAYLCLEYRITR